MYGCVRIRTSATRAQKRASVCLELEFLVLVNCLKWVLGTDLRSSAKAIGLSLFSSP